MLKAKVKYFISYTTRDGAINLKKLKMIEKKMIEKIYIDLLHNNSRYPQLRVFIELFKASSLLVIKTEKTFSSPWVRIEILTAKLLRKKIYYSKLEDFFQNEDSQI